MNPMKIFIYTFLTLISLLGYSESFAQSTFCAGITVETFPLNPQTGSHNYFGVRVTLDKTYSQNVTVTGYIFDQGGGANQNHPFSVTVTSGYTTDQTSATFYETGPTDDAVLIVDAITPTIITSGSTDYNTGCTVVGTSPENSSNAYDYVGQYHNDILNYILANEQTPSSMNAVSTAVYNFYQSKSWLYRADSFFLYADNSGLRSSFNSATDITTVCTTNGFSSTFNSFVTTLLGYLDDDNVDYQTLHDNLVYTEGQISSNSYLTSTEKQILLSAASVGRYSSFYWGIDANISNWETYTGNSLTKVDSKKTPRTWFNSIHTRTYDAVVELTEPSAAVTSPFSQAAINKALYPSLFDDPGSSSWTTSIPNAYPTTKTVMRPMKNYFKWSWKSLGKADLKGAIEGGVAGAIVGGTSTLGGATVPSYVAGAVSWGAACSASNALGQLTGWW